MCSLDVYIDYAKLETVLKKLNFVPNDSLMPCIAGTRAQVLHDLEQWATNDSSHIVWMYGLAGTGKSTAAASFIQILKKNKILGGIHTCRRNSESLKNPLQVWKNLASQLADVFPPYAVQLTKDIENEPLFEKHPYSAKEMFQFLFVSVLEQLDGILDKKPSSLILVIEALDECGTEGQQVEIIDSCYELSKFGWLKICITSRPTDAITSQMSADQTMQMELSTEDSLDDVSLYFHQKFASSRRLKNKSYESEIQRLTKLSQGLFIWASVVFSYLEKSTSPTRLLNYLLMPQETGAYGSEVFLPLYTLYYDILEEAIPRSGDSNKDYHNVFGSIVLAAEPINRQILISLVTTSDMSDPDCVYNILADLSPLLKVTETGKISLIHPSFSEYIQSENCPRSYQITQAGHEYLFQQSIVFLEQNLRFNMYDIETSCILNQDIESLAERIDSDLQGALYYATRYYLLHFLNNSSSQLAAKLVVFWQQHLLHWLEVVSALGKVLEIENLTSQVVLWQQSNKNSDLYMTKDVFNFIHQFFDPLSTSIPHIYISALAFVPAQSWVAKEYWPVFPNRLQIKQDEGLLNKNVELLYLNDNIRCLTASKDGSCVVMNEGNKIILWNRDTRERKVLQGHTKIVSSVIYSSDMNQLVSGSWDRTVKVWNFEGEIINVQTLEGHTDYVTSVTYSSSTRQIISCSYDKTIRFWNVDSGAPNHIIENPNRRIHSLACSLDGTCLASGYDDGFISVWKCHTYEKIWGIDKAYVAGVACLAFSPSGKYITAGSFDHKLAIWDTQTGEKYGDTLSGHASGVSSVAYSPDGKMVISGSGDGTVKFWSTQTGKLEHTLKGHTKPVTCVIFCPDGKQIISGSDDNTVRVWDAPSTTKNQLEPIAHTKAVKSVIYSPDGTQIASGSEDKTIRIWDVTTGQLIKELSTEPVLSLCYSPDGKCIAAALSNFKLCIYRVEDGQVISILSGHPLTITSVVYSPDGTQLASSSSDKSIRVWDASTGEQVGKPLRGHTETVTSIAYLSSKKSIVSGSLDKSIRIWDAETGQQIKKPLMGHRLGISSVICSPDKQQIASSSHDCCIQIWNVDTQKKIGPKIESHESGIIVSITYSSDGKYLISGAYTGAIKIWDVKTGLQVGPTLEGHADRVTAVAFSSTENQIASGSGDTTVRIWNVPHIGEQLGAQNDGYPSGIVHTQDSVEKSFFRLHLSPSQDHTEFSQNGWYNHQADYLLWVPSVFRESVNDWSTIAIGAIYPSLCINLDKFVYGAQWTQVKSSHTSH